MAPGEHFAAMPSVKVDGAPLPEDVKALLDNVVVDESVNVASLLELSFHDNAGIVIDKGKFKVGSRIALELMLAGRDAPTLLLQGEVTTLEFEHTALGSRVIVRAIDAAHRLLRGRRVRAFLQRRAGDIVSEVAHGAGISVGYVEGPSTELVHVAQVLETDGDFLHRLASEVGCSLRLIDGALCFATAEQHARHDASRPPVTIDAHVGVYSLRVGVTSASQVAEVAVRGWDSVQKRAITTSAAVGDGAHIHTTTGDVRRGLPDTPMLLSRPSTQSHDVLQASADAAAASLGGGFAEISGEVAGDARLHAGVPIQLRNCASTVDGDYVLSAVRHAISSTAGYRCSIQASSGSERSLFALASRSTSHTARNDRLTGVLPALVDDNNDPQQLGRVRVTFPSLSEDFTSAWARMTQAGAGDGRGWVLLPEVGDEVLVAFEHGSFDAPYVIGGLYNGHDKPKAGWGSHVNSTDGTVSRRAFVSRTGMVLEMKESPDGESLTVSTNEGKQRVTLMQKSNSGIEIVSEGPVSVTAKTSVTVTTSGGDISLEASSGKVSLKGSTVEISASAELSLHGAKLKASADSSAELSGATLSLAGSATAELKGGATTLIKGGLVQIN